MLGADLRFGSKHGYVNDDLSGMRLLGARCYVPALGRFLTQDPVGHEGGLNLYAYCSDSPLLNADPSGTDKTLIVYGAQGSNAPGDDPDIRASSDRIASRYEDAGGRNDQFLRVDTTEDALKYAKWADRLVWIGHADDGQLFMDGGESLTAQAFSAARDGRHLKSVDLVGCDTLVNAQRAEAWSNLSDGHLRGTYSSLPINLYSYNLWPFNQLATYRPGTKHYRGLFPGFNYKGKKHHIGG